MSLKGPASGQPFNHFVSFVAVHDQIRSRTVREVPADVSYSRAADSSGGAFRPIGPRCKAINAWITPRACQFQLVAQDPPPVQDVPRSPYQCTIVHHAELKRGREGWLMHCHAGRIVSGIWPLRPLAVQDLPDQVEDPIHYFELLWTQEVWSSLVANTNSYVEYRIGLHKEKNPDKKC
jgi:hypothetical protein